MNNETWQKCPICNGNGTIFYPVSNNTSAVCTVCNGKKIISNFTGLPPGGLPQISSNSTNVKGDTGEVFPLNNTTHETTFEQIENFQNNPVGGL